MRGGKPKPIQRQIAEGDPSKRGVHKLDEALRSLPHAEQGLPDCPADLGPVAREAWNFWREELTKMGLAFRPDSVMLEGACVHFERAKLADGLLKRHGILIAEPVTDRNGRPTGATRVRNNPALAVSNQAWALVRSFCSEFGLSPVGRQRLAVEAPDTSREDLLELLSRPRTPRTPVQ